MRSVWIFLAAALSAPLLSACGPSEEKIEAERVLRAIDVLRDSPPEPLAAREALVAELEKQPATKSRLASEARDKCARAYRLLTEGKALQAKVSKALAQPAPPASADPGGGGEKPASATAEMLRDFLAAEAKIKESAAAMPECAEAAANLRRPQAAGR